MKKIYPIFLLLAMVIFLLSCGGKDKEALSGNKLVQIAVWEDKRQADTLLFNFLMDPDAEIRARACYALGMIAPQGASAYIAELLADSNDRVRLGAVFTLGLLADSLYATRMIPLLDDPIPEIRHHSVITLGKMGGSQAVSILNQLATDSLPQVRAWAAEGLWRAKADGRIEILRELVRDSVFYVELAAVQAFRYLKDPDAAGNLRFRLRDTIPEIRMAAARGLEEMNDSSALINLTEALARETDWRVKTSLISAIQMIGDKRAIKALLNILRSEEHPLVTSLALETIAHLKIATLIPKMNPYLDSDNQIIKGAVIVALAQFDGEDILARIENELPGYGWYLKAKSAEALQYINSPKARQLLERLFRDSDPCVRVQAFESITIIDSANLEPMMAALDDSDMAVNAAAVDFICSHRLENYLDDVIDLYKSADDNADLRFAVLYPMEGWIVDSQIISSKAADLLEMALDDGERTIRNLAIKAYAQAGIDKKSKLGHFETDINDNTYAEYYKTYTGNPIAEINTEKGQIRVELLYDMAPKTVVNFINLCEQGFYDNTIFNRVVPNFVIQAGDPRGDGMGGPGYTIRCEYNRHEYNRGTMGMAHAGKDTGGSQFFICHSPQPHLNAKYTAFGQVIYGMRIVDRILVGDSINSIEIIYPE